MTASDDFLGCQKDNSNQMKPVERQGQEKLPIQIKLIIQQQHQ